MKHPRYQADLFYAGEDDLGFSRETTIMALRGYTPCSDWLEKMCDEEHILHFEGDAPLTIRQQAELRRALRSASPKNFLSIRCPEVYSAELNQRASTVQA
jgi:hypothetical protein